MRDETRRRRYAIIHQNIFSEMDWQRFGCELFDQNGFEVVPVELLYGYQDDEDTITRGRHKSIPQAVRVRNRDDLDALLKTFNIDDIILCVTPFNQRLYWIYHVFTKYDLRYAVMTLNAYEGYWLNWAGSAKSAREYFNLRFAEGRAFVRRLLTYLNLRLTPRFAYWMAQPPTWWFRGGSDQVILTCYFPKRHRAKVIKAHALNYETVLGISTDREELFPGQHSGGYIVFLDQALVDHPDYSVIHNRVEGKAPPASAERYYASMRRFFDMLERQTGHKVVVAACPKANYDPVDNPFRRLMYYGETAYLSKHAEFVVCTTTTAISFAVVYDKPVLFITTDEVESNRSLLGDTLRMMSSLRGKRINVDDLDDDGVIPIPKIDPAVYADYIHRFIKEPGASDLPFWEIFFAETTGRQPMPLSVEQEAAK